MLLAEALISLYQATFDEKWLYKARDLANYAIEHFYDNKSGMFFYTSDIDPELVARKMETGDNVIPGSNSVMAKVLFQIGVYFDNADHIAKSKQMVNNVKHLVVKYASFYSNWAIVTAYFAKQPFEIAIVGENAAELRAKMDKYFLPNAFYLGGEDEGTLSLLESKLQEGQTTIYVCQKQGV